MPVILRKQRKPSPHLLCVRPLLGAPQPGGHPACPTASSVHFSPKCIAVYGEFLCGDNLERLKRRAAACGAYDRDCCAAIAAEAVAAQKVVDAQKVLERGCRAHQRTATIASAAVAAAAALRRATAERTAIDASAAAATLPVYHQVGLLESCVLLQGAPRPRRCQLQSAPQSQLCQLHVYVYGEAVLSNWPVGCGNVYLVNEVEYDMALDSDPQMWHCDPQMWVPFLNTEFLFDFFDRSCCN